MVCPRCISTMAEILQSEELTPESIKLGEVVLPSSLSTEQKDALRKKISDCGFEWIEDEQSILTEKIRIATQKWVRQKGENEKLSQYITKQLGKDYSTLSKLFRETKGITIERFAILHKIEYAKELLSYNQFSVSEIAYILKYSSVAHFSSQFKQITGYTPKAFQKSDIKQRTSLSDL